MSSYDESLARMSKVDELKTAVRTSATGLLSDRDIRRADHAIDTLVAEIARTVNVDQSDVEASITHFYLAKRDDVRTIAVAFARRQIGTGGGHGHLPWPLDCHKKFELCWPHPQNPDLLVFLEVEIPWPCPDEIIL